LISLLPLPNPLAAAGSLLPTVTAPMQAASPAPVQPTTAPVTINLVIVRIDLPTQSLLGSQSVTPILVGFITRDVPAVAPITDVLSPALANFIAAMDRAFSSVSDAPVFAPTLGRIGNPVGSGGLLGRGGSIDMTNLPGVLSPVNFVPPNVLPGGTGAPGQTPGTTQEVGGSVSRGFLTFPNGTFFIETVIAGADLGFAPALLVPPATAPESETPAAPSIEGPTFGAEAVAPLLPSDEVPGIQMPDEPAGVQAASFVPSQLIETLRVDPFGLVTVLSAAVGAWYHGTRRLERKPRLRPTEDVERNV